MRVYIHTHIHTHIHIQDQSARTRRRDTFQRLPNTIHTHIHTHIYSIKVRVHVGATPFNAFQTPLLSNQRPAGAVVSFKRPPAAKFKKDLKIKIKVLRWIVIVTKVVEETKRRALGDGEFVLDEDELKNTYHENGALMWRGRRLMHIRATEENKVEMASFNRETQVPASYVNKKMYIHTHTYTRKKTRPRWPASIGRHRYLLLM